ncbi:hypothetical protein OEZ86_009592 [Tetradesmus obliquus]|uniref:ATP-dependent RNA helicase n=1 Tax=Tetradesmus obliquus TaxID=3088 RepID=A0ABY8UNB7_TETOB|nr:hypothetical protein OEZ85_001036 [Tetradesmus obliquus]WIA43064.1 hypothetical protein OEZ86_009592 [Tetradesmus obliquus]
MAAEDFNPGFAFDAGDFEAPAQAPWEFGGALKMALKDRQQPASTIDDKINKRLQDRQQKQQQKQQARKGAQAAGKKRAREESSEDEDDSEAGDSDDDDDDAAGSSEESDQPLPGELDSDEVSALGYTHPTPIQAACIPLALAGRDICGSAMTSSGKTAAFAHA